jgi:hypothetical protein
MTLPLDISRCAGRFGLGPDDPICERRHECARFVALLNGDGADESGRWRGVPVATGLCRDGDDYFIEMDAADLGERAA